ncbi:MAG: SDR family oxidoreductase, partial [Hyphomicrobiaceae bacterium]|nr:SDR family oxidoreductase [Hyphomicrobiaceae bacterium]
APGYRSVFRPGLFDGQVVIVTGGGSGIGRCVAHELASLGARIALVGRKAEKIAAVAGEIAGDVAAGRASTHVCDIRLEEQVVATVAEILKAHGRIDGLVNNAGGQFAAPLVNITQKGWETVVRTNLTGGFLMARECYTQWMQGRGGSIVNVVADMWLGMPAMGHSGAARAGMVNFTETAANEWSVSNVRVNAVAPGWIASSGMDQYPPEMGERIRNMKNIAPLGRMGTESEVASAIVFLLSEGASYISGSTLRIDGAAPNTKISRPLPPNRSPLPRYDGFHRASLPKVLGEE